MLTPEVEIKSRTDAAQNIRPNSRPIMNTSKFMRPKNRNDVILMNLRWDKPMLKVFQKRTNYLGYMGIPGRGGNEHYLYPEEAVFLVEVNSAVIFLNGKVLPLSAAYTILKKFGISLLKYAAYIQLAKAGYVLRRPSNMPMSIEQAAPSIPATSQPFHQPRDLLDCFPGFSQDGKFLIIPQTTIKTPVLGMLGLDNEPKLDQISKLAEDIRQKAQIRQGHEPWTRCRPVYWPSFESLRSSENWNVYSKDKERLQKMYREQQDSTRRVNKLKNENYDFDIYANDGSYTHTKPMTPMYKLLVADDRYNNQIPSPIELADLTRGSSVELLVASGDPGHLRFCKCNGDPMVL